MEIIKTALDGVVEIRSKRHGDERGWFSETYKRNVLRDAGIDIDFVQIAQNIHNMLTEGRPMTGQYLFTHNTVI